MELHELVGTHMLDALDYGEMEGQGLDGFYTAQCVRFRLDGILYRAEEDPDDGYRCMCSDLVVDSSGIANVFAPVLVNCAMHGSEDKEILQISAVCTGALILSVGTDRYDSYYPYFVCDYLPQNIPKPEDAVRRVVLGKRKVRIRRY